MLSCELFIKQKGVRSNYPTPFCIYIFQLSRFLVTVCINHCMDSRKYKREIVEEMVINFRITVMDECYDNQCDHHSKSGGCNCLVISKAECSFVLNTVFHSVKQVQIKTDHHPYYQSNPGIQW